MKRMNTMARAVGIAVLALTAACSDSAEQKSEAAARDAADTAEKAGDAVSDAARDAGDAVSDAAKATGDAVMNGGRAADAAVETMDVKAALIADTRIDSSRINVDTDHVTKTVTLRGSVPTGDQKALAEEVAEAKATGYQVSNRLVVGG